MTMPIRDFTDAELDTLDIKVRNLVTMCVCNGNPYEMAARQYGIPVGTVKNRINRAREKIAKRRAMASDQEVFGQNNSGARDRSATQRPSS